MAVSRRWVYVRKCADNFHLHQCWYYYNNLLANYVETSSIYCTLLLSYENVEYKICNQLPATHTHTHTHLLLHNTIIFICTYKIMVFFACFREVNRMCVCRLSTGSRTVIRKKTIPPVEITRSLSSSLFVSQPKINKVHKIPRLHKAH